jgi:hypothetical protein
VLAEGNTAKPMQVPPPPPQEENSWSAENIKLKISMGSFIFISILQN